MLVWGGVCRGIDDHSTAGIYFLKGVEVMRLEVG